MSDFVAEQRERQRRLLEQLEAEPVVELTGLVDEHGVSSGRWQGETLSTMTVTLEAWRIGDGPTRTDALVVRRQVDESDVPPLLQKFGMENIVRLRVRVCEGNVFGSPQALLVDFIGRVEDADLRKHQQLLKTPIVRNDKILGQLN